MIINWYLKILNRFPEYCSSKQYRWQCCLISRLG